MASSFLEKKAKKQAEELEKKYGSSAYGGTTWLNEQLTGKTTKKNTSNDDIAPVKTSKKEEDEPWYKSGLFADGYDFGDISKTILGLDKKNESVSPSKNLESLLTVYSNDDFKAKSGYVSTAAEGFWDRFGSKYGMGYNDLQYEYINNQNGIRGDIDAKAASWGADTGKTTSSYKEKALDFMTEEEVAVYNYYYQTEGKDKAEEFLDALAETLNARKAGKTFDSVQGNTTLEILSGFVAGNEQFEQGVKNLGNMIVGKDDYIPQTATQILTGKIREDLADDGFNVLGSSVGQMAFDAISTGTNMIPSIAVGAVNPVAGAALIGASAAGNAYQQDLNEGNDKGEARLYATTIGVLEGALQYALGGIGKLGGTSATISRAVSGIKNGALKFALEYGGKIASEGLEEGLQEVLDPIVKNVIHGTDEEVDWENVAYSALLGGVMGGVFGASEVSNTTLNKNETAVVEKVFNDLVAESETDGKKLTNREKNKLYDSVVKDMERGYISTDTIEDILGDKSSYDALSKEAEEYDTLYNTPSGQLSKAQQDRLTELDSKNKANPYKDALNVAKDQYSQSVFELVKSDRLAESYNEKGRRSQVYQADLTQYDAKQQAVVQKAIDSGVLNNTNRTHEFVDMIAKISADKGVLFDFTNNAKLKDSGFAIDGKAVNGYVTKDGITLNIDSAKSLNSVVGHEITHVLEGTELYDTLKQAVFDYAKSKGEYDSRLSKLTETYKSVKDADIDAELAADLVGDYLFTDSDFIHRLSTENRNVFQKIYDEIKYLCRVVTAGSKEARELEKVKKAFEDAYRANGTEQSGTKHSISETTDGRFAAVVDNDILSNIDTSSWDNTKKAEAKKAANDALKQFSDGIVVDGITRKVNKVSRREYTRSNYTESLYNQSPEVFADKMRAAEVADDIVVAATNWNRDGGLKHPRSDNFVDFDHGKTLIVSGDAKYIAEVVVGITDTGEAVFYDVVDMQPTTFDIKKSESPTTATTQNAIGDIQGDSFTDNVAQNGENVKYSLSDSDGKQLTKEQQEYFKDSKVRDETGNLKVMYHGTSRGGFNVFDTYKSKYGLFGTGFYFTDSENIGKSYTKKGKGNNPQVYEAYLNIKNPLDMDAQANPAEWAEAFDEVDFPESGTNEDFYRAVEEYYADQYMSKWEVAEIIQGSIESGMGYDGITHIGGGRVNPDGERHQVYIAFQPEQIKSVANTQPTGDADIRYSLSEDSNGKKLSAEQSEYFKDSKAVDANGNLQIVYHGTRNADFTVFKRNVNFFTDSKEMADSYSPNGAMYEGYVNITKPYEIDAQGEKWSKIPIDAATKDFLQEYGASVFKEGGKWRTTPADLASAIEEAIDNGDMDYDGIIIRNVDDTGSYYKGEGKNVATDYIVFNSNQFKNADNTKPTADKDIRFSLSEAVEETKDLMALHNLTEQKLLKSLKLGGLPMPSVAIAKAQDGHGEFGEISLILPRDAVDPQTSSRNKLYSGDAWTPTYPSVDYKPSEKVLRKVKDKIAGLVPYEVQNALGNLMFDTDNASDYLNRYSGNMAEAFSQNDAMKYAYLKDTGSDISLPMKEADLYLYGGHSNAAVRYFSGKLVNGLKTVELYRNMSARDLLQDKALAEAVADAQNFDVLRTMEPGSDEYLEYERNPAFSADEVSFRDIDNFLSAARKLLKNGVQQTVDRKAAKELIRDAVDQTTYERWLEGLFSGVVEKEGIRNNKDYFTPSGNRRSFEALHYEHNLENVIKAMRGMGEKGIGNGFGGASIFGASTTEFSSIEEMKQSRDRLQRMSYDEYQELRKGFTDRFLDIAMSLPNQKNSFTATDSAAEVLTEAVAKYRTRSGIANYLRKELNGWATYSEQVVDDLIELVNDIRKMPTGYFEAKPQRAVTFDEVGVFVIPNNADIKLKQELLNRGYAIAEYDPNIEGHRQQVVNQFEEYKFSLSEAGEKPRRYGDYNIYGKDIGVNDPLAEFAPVAENATTKESVAPVVVSKKENTTVTPEEMRELFPDDLAPNELDTLLQEKEALEGRMLEMANSEDFTEFDAVTDRYAVVMSGIEALKKDEADRIGSLDDADIPPEREAVRGYGAVTAEDPFADRSETAVGSQKIKAYQYENPEVKPFFREAAYDLAEDIANSQPAERWYNDELYYASGGENGFGGQKRLTTKDIGDFKDAWGCSWDDLREAVNDIIEDHGKENHALAKRVEFLINDRLMYGYTNIRGERIEPNQAYLDFLKEKQINEYSKEAREAFFANAEEYAPADIAPVPAAPTKVPTAVNPYDSIGAAPYGFDPITQLQYEYGNLPDGEHPVREDSMPKSTNGKDKVSLTARTVKGAGATPDEFVDLLHKETLGGRFSYIPIKNSDTVQKAYDEIVKKGWEVARGEWEAKVRRGEVSAELTATGSLLLNHAAKAGDRTAWLSVLHDYQIMGTNAGQAIQAMRILKTLTPDDSLYMIERSVEQMVEDMKLGADIVIDENLKQNYLNAETDGERETARQAIAKDVARQIPSTAMDKWTALRYLNMLGNLRTQGRNILGNLGMSVTSGVKNTVATSIEWIANKASGGKFHRTKSIFVNKDQLKAAKNDFANVKDVALNGGKFNDPMAKTLQFQQEVQDARKIFKIAPLERYRRGTNWAMDTGDLVFSKVAYGRALAGYLKANGIKETDFSKIDQKTLDEARAYAINEAQETTFRDNNWLSSWVSKVGRRKDTPKAGKMISEGVMPFRKTPANILLRAEEYSPLGIVNATVKSIQAAKGNVTGADVVNSWAKALTGTGLFALGMWLNNSGMLSGGPDEDDDKDWFEEQYGWQNYAIQIGDKNYTIDFLSPAAMPLLMGAQLNELRQESGVELKDLEKALLSIADPMIEMSMLQGVNDTLDNIRYAESNMGQFLINAGVSYLTQGLTNSFLGQLERSLEGQRMSTYTDKDSDLPAWLQKALGKASAKTPGLDYQQIPYVDAWGETEDIAPLPGLAENALSPSYIEQGITDAVYEELNRLNDAQSDINVYPQTPDKTVTFDDAYGNRHEDYNLSAEEYVELAQLQGQTQKALVEDILSNYQYSGLTDKEKARAVQLAYQYAKEYSRQEVLNADGFSSEWMAKADAENDIVNAIIAHTNEEMTFAYENPEKYQFFTENGISWDDYDSADEDTKREYSNMYSWVSDEEHPGRYAMSKAISDDFQTFWQYKSDCNNFDAKDENGETVNGLKKERVIDYINSLDIDYGARIILFRSMYSSKQDKEDYNMDIVNYLNSREDLTYEDIVTIMEELDFTVDSEGNVTWD